MEYPIFKPGPYTKGQIVQYPLGTYWGADVDIKYASAYPRDGAYWTKIPVPPDAVQPVTIESRLTALEARVSKLEGVQPVPSTKLSGKIPYKAEWAFVNDSSNQKTEQFFDSALTDVNLDTNYKDSRSLQQKWVVFEFPDHMEVELSRIVFKDGPAGTVAINCYLLDLNYTLKQIFSYDGTKNIDFALPTARVKAFVMDWVNPLPVEIEFYGNYKLYVPFVPKRADAPFEKMCGTVTYPYDYMNPPESEEVKRAMLQATGINRIYIDKDWVYSSVTGKYHFAPLYNKAWNLDYIFQMCNQYGIDIIPCLKGNEGGELYPELVEQFVIRYGSNKNVPLEKVKQFVGGDPWAYQDIQIGLGLCDKIQVGNEPERTWSWVNDRAVYSTENPNGYLSPFQYAAQVAKCNELVKAIDPAIEVILGGLYSKRPGYIRGMLLWGKMYYGGKKFFDSVAYHDYNSTDDISDTLFGPGISPDRSGMQDRAEWTLRTLQEFGWPDIKVYITETGYSLNSLNPEKSLPVIEGKTKFQLQGEWIMRSLLRLSRAGVAGVTPYELYQNGSNPGRYDERWLNWDLTCGIVDLDKKTPLPAWHYQKQMKELLSGLVYKETVQSSPEIDLYQNSAGVRRFVSWWGTEENKKSTYNIGRAATIYTLTDTGAIQQTTGTTIEISEKPIIFE
jgi:hypothetical protein